MNSLHDEAAAAFSQAYYATLERFIVTAIEEIEGRMCSNEEVRLYGLKEILPDGTVVLKWKGVEFARLPPPVEVFQRIRIKP